MKSNYNDNYTKDLLKMLGIKKVYYINCRFYNTQVLVDYIDGRSITVADLLKSIENMLSLIKATFDVNQEKYSEAIKLLQALQMILNNQKPKDLRKEKMNLLIDVVHELSDLNTTNDFQKQENERIAYIFKLLIEKQK